MAAAAEGGACDPGKLPDAAAIDPCLKDTCCTQLTRCSQEPACWSCFESGDGASCAGNTAYLSLQSCASSCQIDGAAGGEGGVQQEVGAEAPVRTVSTLAIVHASANLRPFRACIADGPSSWVKPNPMPDDPGSVMPHSNVIGVAPGGALVLPGAEQFTNYGGKNLTLYLIPTSNLEGKEDKSCKDLICSGVSGCLDAQDYHVLPDLTLGLITGAESVELFVIRGCTGNDGSPERCGADYTAGGNLGVTITSPYELDTITQPPEGTMRVTAAQLSQSAEALWSVDSGPGLLLTYGALGDPNAGLSLIADPHFGNVMPVQEVSVPQAGDADLPAFAQKGFTLSVPQADGGSGPFMEFSLAQVQALSSPTDLPPSYWNASSHFLIALVGDGTDPAKQLELPDGGQNPTFDGYGLHVLAIPLVARPASTDP